jgi:uncharacterized protein (TIGR02145 family)
MKRINSILACLLLIATLLFTQKSTAQAPQKMSYQSVIRNSSNVLLANTQVGIRISVLQGSAAGTAVYVETQTATTNGNGLMSLQIGTGIATTGTFAGINWATGPYFIKTETDPSGGTNYSITGTQEILSVPYALNGITAAQADAITAQASAIESLQSQVAVLMTPSIPTVSIGTQSWQQFNLDVSIYRDGTVIPQVTDQTAWANLTTGAWCYVNNDPTNGSTYGKLYNWYAVAGIHDNDPNTANKKLAPLGFHIPTTGEWTTLSNYLGGASEAGTKIKSTQLWSPLSTAGTNSSGFTGLPGGARRLFGSFFLNIGGYGAWWSSSQSPIVGPLGALSRFMNSDFIFNNDISDANEGLSVRCIRD